MNCLRVPWRWLAEGLSVRPVRFAKYQPARRLGTRRLEDRLLRRLGLTTAELGR